jgi:hypothetical protein
MTDFEKKTIKREMTREKFLEIRDHIYGDGNTFNYTYGQVSSWLTWNRNKNGKISNKPPPFVEFTQRGHYYDGPIDNWDHDKLLPVECQFSSRITTDIVFIGLNMSGNGTPADWPSFQNARGHRRIVETFFGTAAEGAYFTDIIKPDKRFLNNVETPANSAEVMRIIKARRDVLKEHINLFKSELDFIGAVNPLLVVFGNDANWILEQGMGNYYLTKKFYAIVNILHYGAYPNGGDEGYKNGTRRKLKTYITIPEENINSSGEFHTLLRSGCL